MELEAPIEVKPTVQIRRDEQEGSPIDFFTLSRSSSPVDEIDGSKHFKLDSKVCRVCGDKALGNNFNAITCESCKAFFRRNALKQKEFVCPFNDKCKVDPVTRRFCQKCRLKKCIEIGMKKEWIMTEEEKKLKKRKIEQNRAKRQSLDSSSDSPPPKTPCLTDFNSQGTRNLCITNITNHAQFSPPDPTLPQNVEKQPMMPYMEAGAVSTTFGQGNNENEVSVVQSPILNMDPHSPGSSDSSSDISVAYTAPASGQMTPLHMSQIEAAQLLNKSSLTSHNGQHTTDLMEVEGHNTMGLMTNQECQVPDDQSFHWQNDSSNHNSRLYGMTSFIMYPNQGDKVSLRAADISPPILVGQGNKYTSQSATQAKTGNPTSQMIPSNQSYQMPLLSSLIRPGEPESPEFNTTTVGIGNHVQRNSDYGASFGHEQQLQSSPAMEQMTPGGMRPSHSQQYGSCHSSVPYRVQQEEDVPPPLPLNTMDSILSVAIRAEFNAFGMMNKRESLSKDLNGAETAKLQELLMACQALGDPVDQEGPVKLSKNSDPTLINVINLTDIAIRRLIKMSKKIYAFKNMCQEDQIALLKGGCTEMMILRSVVTYDPDRDSWNIPHSFGYNIKLGVLKEARGNLYEEHQRFVKSFKPEWRTDENIMILLCAITLFTAERPNVIHKDVVKLEQDSYYYLLKRYLESIVNGCEARSTYLHLIRKIAELRILNSNHLRVFLEVNPREVEPLLREVFSMV